MSPTTAPNTRPYRPAHLPGDERVTHAGNNRQTWRQIGWHGQSGAFYALGEDPSRHELGSFSPLWLLVDDEAVLDPAAAERPMGDMLAESFGDGRQLLAQLADDEAGA